MCAYKWLDYDGVCWEMFNSSLGHSAPWEMYWLLPHVCLIDTFTDNNHDFEFTSEWFYKIEQYCNKLNI